jgi:hypothetical protein
MIDDRTIYHRTMRSSLAILPALLLIASAVPAQTIPPEHATTLANQPIELPQALLGRKTVLLVSFSRASTDNVTAWFHDLANDYRSSPTVLYYALPVVAGAPGFLRGIISRKIGESVSTPARPRFVPIPDHEAEWKLIAGFSKNLPDSETYLVLVDGTGQVRYHTPAGAPTPQAYADLKQHLEQLKP